MLAVRDRSNTQAPPVWRATGLERQVFLDEAGRRRRLVAVLGIVAALLTAAWLVLLVSGALSFAPFPSGSRTPVARVIVHR